MTDEIMYSIRVEADHRQLLQIIGKRETVIEAALRVILDSAKPWDESYQPMFTVYAMEI